MSNANTTPNTITHSIAQSIILATPIVRGDTQIEAISLRKPASGELRGMALSDLLRLDVDALITLIPRISMPTLTEAECRELDVADLTEIGTEVVCFFMSAKSPKA